MKLNLKTFLTAASAVLTIATTLPASAQDKPVRINLGTLAPRGSAFHQSLQTMAEQWRKTAPNVKLVIYPDGTQGSEFDMVRLMNVDSLQAGLLTVVGLSKIDPGVAGLQYAPMMFHDLDELDAVQAKLSPMLEKRIEDKGYVVLFWVDAGWVRYFSSKPLIKPDDLKHLKSFVWAGDVDQTDIMRGAGYQPVGLETSDIPVSLKTGAIDTVVLPPIYALATQIDANAPHMLNLNWAPLVGACVVKKSTWEKIPAATRDALLAAAKKAGNDIQTNSRKESDQAVAAMKKRGLIVHEVSPELEAQWRAAIEPLYPKIRGPLIPPEIFDEVEKLVKEYRAANANKTNTPPTTTAAKTP
jgi:TRAP-type C4-dicarboxylate transport system substrate-binding protein